jgi:hypothetical protein
MTHQFEFLTYFWKPFEILDDIGDWAQNFNDQAIKSNIYSCI